jgi:hypothetical protein
MKVWVVAFRDHGLANVYETREAAVTALEGADWAQDKYDKRFWSRFNDERVLVLWQTEVIT